MDLNLLDDIKSRYLNELKNQLFDIENQLFNIQAFNNGTKLELKGFTKIDDIVKKINKDFLGELNSNHIEQKYSDEERIYCYDEFRSLCVKEIEIFNKNFMQKKTY